MVSRSTQGWARIPPFDASTGRGRPQVRATSRPQDVVLGNFKIYSRLGLGTSICIRNELAQDRDTTKSLAGEDRKSMRRQDSEIRWCQDLLKAGPGYLHSIRAGTDTGTGTHHWQGKTASSSDIKTSRCGTRELQDIFEARAKYLNMHPRRTGPRTGIQIIGRRKP